MFGNKMYTLRHKNKILEPQCSNVSCKLVINDCVKNLNDCPNKPKRLSQSQYYLRYGAFLIWKNILNASNQAARLTRFLQC